ncbi:solute carrier organic anion transporter family member 4C1-like [Limulus polyphemus]|uniref:Solute carrier organic anion transporter family member 4C1-like n=1 Tax=Limulus polyphemus TaxID=6850 RepID=A0ABM1SZR7_LIMPO|nr:solute carrier organic anion transporter family member 4C1-like [Limulus polyphemus]
MECDKTHVNQMFGGLENVIYTVESYDITNTNPEEIDDVGRPHGIGRKNKTRFQFLLNPKFLLFTISVLIVIQGMFFSYFVGIVYTLEKRYAVYSTISGFILIAGELSPILLGGIIGYFSQKSHRPRIIGLCMVVSAIGCFVCTLPYFIHGPGLHLLISSIDKNSTYDLCGVNKREDYYCSSKTYQSTALKLEVIILFLGSMLKGVGYIGTFIIGIPLVDDNAKKKDSPVYIGVTLACKLLGPALGFMLASFCIKFYEDPGYMAKTFRQIALNPILVCHTFGITLRLVSVIGYMTLMSKYMEVQFHQTASGASFFSGLTIVLSMVLGILAGSVVIRKVRPQPRSLLAYILSTETLSLVLLLIVMFISCAPPKIAGLTKSRERIELNQPCNDHCNCSTRVFHPVCGYDVESTEQITFFSPCFAGCQSINLSSKILFQEAQSYSSCSCLETNSEVTSDETATTGYCESYCNMFVPYIVLCALGKIIYSTGSAGNQLVPLRCVDPKDKGVALGLKGAVVSLFAFLPAPVIFGFLADDACTVWEEECGSRGNCWLYDLDKFRYNLHGASFGFFLAGSLFDLGVFLLAPRMKDLYDDEKDKMETIF